MRDSRVAFVATLVTLVVLWSPIGIRAEEEESSKEPKHHVSVLVGITYIPEGEINPDDEFVLAPTIGAEYEYELNHRWALAGMMDLELKDYGVESGGKLLQRENVFIIAAVAMYRALPSLLVYLGPGYEFETHESFFVVRVGIKYEIEIKDNWGIAPTVEVDFKERFYSSVFVGVGFGKRF